MSKLPPMKPQPRPVAIDRAPGLTTYSVGVGTGRIWVSVYRDGTVDMMADGNLTHVNQLVTVQQLVADIRGLMDRIAKENINKEEES